MAGRRASIIYSCYKDDKKRIFLPGGLTPGDVKDS